MSDGFVAKSVLLRDDDSFGTSKISVNLLRSSFSSRWSSVAPAGSGMGLGLYHPVLVSLVTS